MKNTRIFALQDRLKNDSASLAGLSFNDLPSEDEWLGLQSIDVRGQMKFVF